MPKTLTIEHSTRILSSTRSEIESMSTQEKDETHKRRSVQFHGSIAFDEGTNEHVLSDLKYARKRSSLFKRNVDYEKTIQGNKVDVSPTMLETVEEETGQEESELMKTLDANPPIYGDILLEGEFIPSIEVVIETVPQVSEMETKPSSNTTQSSSWVTTANQLLSFQQEQESEAQSLSIPLETQSRNSKDSEIAKSDLEQKNSKTSQPRPSVGYVDASNSGLDNKDAKFYRKMNKMDSVVPRIKNRRKSSVFKEIIGSIEKKKGPIFPEKLGFGSSEERKALVVEDLKNKRKSQMITPKESDEMLKPLDRKKTIVHGLGFGSSEKRKTLFDKDDSLKLKEKKKSLISKNDEKDPLGGKGRRFSLMDPRGSSTQSAIIATVPKEPAVEVLEGARQDLSQASKVQNEQATEAKQLKTIEVNQKLSEENQEPLNKENEFGSNITGDISQDAHYTIKNFAKVESAVERNPSIKELVDDDKGSTEHQSVRDRAPSIYGSEAASSNYYGLLAPPIDAIALDDNEELASTLLAEKVDEPLRNELENWLSSAINCVDNNLYSSWIDPFLRQDTSKDKDSSRRSIPPTDTPRNTMVAQPELSSTLAKGLSRRLRRLSPLSLGILAGTISDENQFMHLEQHTDSTLSSDREEHGSSVVEISPRLMPKFETSRLENEDKSQWNQETTEEGLKRLQREVEQRAWAQYVAKRIPCLVLPNSFRKKKKLGECADYLHAKSNRDKCAQDNILNKDMLCYYGGTEDPEKLKIAELSCLNITRVEIKDLKQFQNLQYLDLSVNKLNMHDLWTLSMLRKLSLMSNQICNLSLMSGQFLNLQALDLSYNILGGFAIVALGNLPALETLNLDHNTIDEIPEASVEPWSFNHLRILSATHNFIKTPSFLPLSKIPRLEKLLLAYNDILGVPDEIKDNAQAFPRLQILDLANNKVVDSQRLTPLLQCRTLKQVLLWETPMARKLACDGTNRLLDSARPILLHILRAEHAGQSWITNQSQLGTVEFEAKMHIISQYKAPDIKLFDSMAEQEMAHIFQYTSEMINKEVGDKHCTIHKGYLSAILPFTEGLQNPVMSISETKATDRPCSAPSEVATGTISPSVDEAMESIQISKNLTENHLTDANAAIVCLQNTLGVPLREVTFNPKNYLRMTKSGILRVNECRVGNQEPISSRKDAVYLAQRFLYQAEMETRAQVHNLLERMRLHLAKMDDVLQDTLIEPPPFSPPRRMSEVNTEYTDSEGMLTFR